MHLSGTPSIGSELTSWTGHADCSDGLAASRRTLRRLGKCREGESNGPGRRGRVGGLPLEVLHENRSHEATHDPSSPW